MALRGSVGCARKACKALKALTSVMALEIGPPTGGRAEAHHLGSERGEPVEWGLSAQAGTHHQRVYRGRCATKKDDVPGGWADIGLPACCWVSLGTREVSYVPSLGQPESLPNERALRRVTARPHAVSRVTVHP